MAVQPPVGGPPPQADLVAPGDSGSNPVPVANALGHNDQPAPPDAQPIDPQEPQIPEHARASKGQVIFCAVKLLGLVALSPVLLPVACCNLLGWTIGAAMDKDNKSFAQFSDDVATGVSKTFKPLTRELFGIGGGIIGVTGDVAKLMWNNYWTESVQQQPVLVSNPRVGQAEEERVMAADGGGGGSPQAQPQPAAGLQPPVNTQANQEAERKQREREEEAEKIRRQEVDRSREGLQPPP